MFQAKVVEKIKTHNLYSTNFFSKEEVEKYCTARQATDDNMAGAHCMIDKYDYKHTLKT
jgi:hypothetical protein